MKIRSKFYIPALLSFLFVFCPQQTAYAENLSAAESATLIWEAPKGLNVSNKTHTSITLNWTSSLDKKGKGYQVYRDGKKIITTSKTGYTNSDLVPGRKYSYFIKAYDKEGNVSPASTAVDAITLPDNQAPSVPGSLSVSSPGYTSVVVSWSPSSDNTSVRGYSVYRNGSKIASTTSTSYTVKGLLPGTTYRIFVKALDIAGNDSGQSNEIQAATAPDTIAPDKPSGIKGTSVTETEATLMWSPSSDNVKVRGYEIYCNGERTASTSKTIFTGKNLLPGKSYRYTIKAVDTVGNKSAESDPFVLTTLRDMQKPGIPLGLKAGKIKGSTVKLEWTSATDNVKLCGYIVYCNGTEVARTAKTSRSMRNPSGLGIGIYWIKSYDLAGNISDSSNKVTVITP